MHVSWFWFVWTVTVHHSYGWPKKTHHCSCPLEINSVAIDNIKAVSFDKIKLSIRWCTEIAAMPVLLLNWFCNRDSINNYPLRVYMCITYPLSCTRAWPSGPERGGHVGWTKDINKLSESQINFLSVSIVHPLRLVGLWLTLSSCGKGGTPILGHVQEVNTWSSVQLKYNK